MATDDDVETAAHVTKHAQASYAHYTTNVVSELLKAYFSCTAQQSVHTEEYESLDGRAVNILELY